MGLICAWARAALTPVGWIFDRIVGAEEPFDPSYDPAKLQPRVPPPKARASSLSWSPHGL